MAKMDLRFPLAMSGQCMGEGERVRGEDGVGVRVKGGVWVRVRGGGG